MPVWPITSAIGEPIALSCWQLFFDPVRGGRHLLGLTDEGARVTSAVTSFDRDERIAVVRSGRAYRLIGSPGLSRDTAYVLEQFCRSRSMYPDSVRDDSQLMDGVEVDLAVLLASAWKPPLRVIHLNALPDAGAAEVAQTLTSAFDARLLDHRAVMRMSAAITGSTDASRSAALSKSRAFTMLHALNTSISAPIIINDTLFDGIDEDETAIAEVAELSLLYDARLLAVTLAATSSPSLARTSHENTSKRETGKAEGRQPLLSDTVYQKYGMPSAVIDTADLTTEQVAADVVKHVLANESVV